MQLFYCFYTKGVFPLKQFQKGNPQRPNVQRFSLDHLLPICSDDQLGSSVPLSPDELVGHT